MRLHDSQPNDAFTALPDYPSVYYTFRTLSGPGQLLARLGILRLSYQSQFATLPEQVRREEIATQSSASLTRSFRDEWAEIPAALKQAAELTSLGSRPLIVVTATRLSDRLDGRAGPHGQLVDQQPSPRGTNRAHSADQRKGPGSSRKPGDRRCRPIRTNRVTPHEELVNLRPTTEDSCRDQCCCADATRASGEFWRCLRWLGANRHQSLQSLRPGGVETDRPGGAACTTGQQPVKGRGSRGRPPTSS